MNGFGQVVVGAQVHAFPDVVAFDLRGDEDQRDVFSFRFSRSRCRNSYPSISGIRMSQITRSAEIPGPAAHLLSVPQPRLSGSRSGRAARKYSPVI